MFVLRASGWSENRVRQTACDVSRIPTRFRVTGEFCVGRMILPQLLKKQELCLGCKKIGGGTDAFRRRPADGRADFRNFVAPLTVSPDIRDAGEEFGAYKLGCGPLPSRPGRHPAM